MRPTLKNKTYFLVPELKGPCQISEPPADSGMLVQFESEMPYTNFQECKMTFVCPSEFVVIVDIPRIDIEYDEYCEFDFITFNGNKKCGSRIPGFTTRQS